MHRAYEKLPAEKRSQLRIHITLLDIHPYALARDLCILALMDDLATKEHDEKTRQDIMSAIFYTFIGVVVPPSCHKR